MMGAMAEARWGEVDKMVYGIIWKHVRYYGGDFHELLSEAWLGYNHACNTHDPEKGKFSSWVTTKVSGWLRDQHRYDRIREGREKVRDTNADIHLEYLPKRKDIHSLAKELSGDAQCLLGMILDETGKVNTPRSRKRLSNAVKSMQKMIPDISIDKAIEELKEIL